VAGDETADELARLESRRDDLLAELAQVGDFRRGSLSLLFNLLLSCWFPALWRLCRRRGGWQAGGFSRRAAFRDLAFRVSVRP
jgi:hypothetical protein